ncbi:MAG: PaaI family thioesterase [Desulfobacterales bacterium]|jgi:uncharacterized protein (TIGR00369 family)
MKRSHTITWQDPEMSSRQAGSISGIDYLRAVRDGRIPPPPIANLVGYRIVDVDNGRAVFKFKPAEYHYNPFTTVHGGIAGTVLDTAMTAAVLSTLAAGQGCSTLEIKVNFIRPITGHTGELQCQAKTIHVGNRIATAEAKLKDRRGKLYAHAVSTCMISPVSE